MLDWKHHPRPIIALSPMADMTDSVFCRVVRSVTSASESLVVFREMVSAEAVVRGNEKTLGMTDIHPEERPIVQQLFGSDPDVLARAASIIEQKHHPEGFDLNMGCPVYKLVHHFNGAGLMRDPDRAARIVRQVKSAISVPLSIKIRTGWEDPTECLTFAQMLEEAGADLITVHGRTKTQGYSGQSDWERIAQVRERIAIPVLANGDIHTAPLTLQALTQTRCDGVLIARGALGHPWIFRQIFDVLAGNAPQPVHLSERIETILTHLTLHVEHYGPRGVVTFRKHLSWYFRGVAGATRFKERLHTALSIHEVQTILEEMRMDGLRDEALSSRDALHPLSTQRVCMAK